MNIVHIIMPLLVGALIGYCTNYIAVRMLFHPYYPVKIGKFTLPFTPGIIPKRKPALAKAIGNVVGQNLLNEEELAKALETQETKNVVASGITSVLREMVEDKTLKEIVEPQLGTETYYIGKAKITDKMTEKMVLRIRDMNLGEIIAKQAKESIQNMGGMIAMFVSDSMIESLAEPIGDKIVSYVETDGVEKIQECIQAEIGELEEKSITQERLDKLTRKLNDKICNSYDAFVENNAREIIQKIDVSKIVEDKIDHMKVEELEELMLKVMKHELNAIVNLGALIGLILGLINLAF